MTLSTQTSDLVRLGTVFQTKLPQESKINVDAQLCKKPTVHEIRVLSGNAYYIRSAVLNDFLLLLLSLQRSW